MRTKPNLNIEFKVLRAGKWSTADLELTKELIDKQIAAVKSYDQPMAPAVEDLRLLIESTPEIYMFFNMMFEDVPSAPPYNTDPMHRPQVRNYKQMLYLINNIIGTAPIFSLSGIAGFPISAIFTWPSATCGGFAGLLNNQVNIRFKHILRTWAAFLGSEDSRYVLNKDPLTGWFGEAAMRAMPGFDSEYKCEPGLPYHGFKSWDDFFTREFREGQRPVADPLDDNVITNACESAPYRICTGVNNVDQFWIKGQPYSIKYLLAGDHFAERFTGGTVYQAFLSSFSYHRWHSPVSGTIVKAYVVDGFYFAEAPGIGFDPTAPIDSQCYMAEIATRSLIFIEADNSAIGLMCVIPVGMTEVSSCEITVHAGQKIKKGDQLGIFHYGGSTHCLLFGPHVNLEFHLHGNQPGKESYNIPVKAKIASLI